MKARRESWLVREMHPSRTDPITSLARGYINLEVHVSKKTYIRLMIVAAALLSLSSMPAVATAQELNSYVPHNLVSDVRGLAEHFDPNLVNPWGVALSPTSPFWVSDNGAGVSTLYNGQGEAQPLVVTIPPPGGGTPPSAPTGQVFHGAVAGFEIAAGKPAIFLFATEGGTIAGWNPAVNPTNAITKVDRSTAMAIYKGLALATASNGDHLYAANFHAGAVEVFDTAFNLVSLSGNFTDPNLPAGYAPFNIQKIGAHLFVTYALQDADQKDDVPGDGNGYVNEFDADGNLVRRFASQGTLNAPWGVVRAPAGFGAFGGDLLIGNFGDGRISAFDFNTAEFHGQLQKPNGKAIEIEGLWALVFGNGEKAGDADKLYFTAGIDDESHGLFGQIRAQHSGGEE